MQKTSKKMNVMLVAMNGDGPTTGFAVRVLLVAKTLVSAGFTVTLLRLYPGFKSQGTWREQMRGSDIRLIEVPVLPMARLPILRRFSYLIATPVITQLARLLKIDVIQAEAHEAGMAVLRRKPANVNVIVDFHGAAPEEAESRRQRKDAPSWLDNAESICLKKADSYLVVSPRMIEHLKYKNPNIAHSKYFIVPVNVEELFFRSFDRQEERRRLGFDSNDFVYVYSGGAQDYQCIEEMARLFNILRDNRKNSRMLVISTQKKEIRKIFEHVCPDYVSEIVFESAQKSQVPLLLSAADTAFLLRKNEILNHVSCPTKFGEYLACGLPVITTPWAGHAPDIVRSHDAGVVVEFDLQNAAALVESYVDRLTEVTSGHCKAVAKKLMCWEQSARSLMDCYRWIDSGYEIEPGVRRNLHDEVVH